MRKLRYYIAVLRWMWQHRTEKDCRQKWRRMDKDIARRKGAFYDPHQYTKNTGHCH